MISPRGSALREQLALRVIGGGFVTILLLTPGTEPTGAGPVTSAPSATWAPDIGVGVRPHPDLHGLFVGVSDYDDEHFANLRGTSTDVAGVYDALVKGSLREPDGRLIEKSNAVLLEGRVELAGFRRALSSLVARLKRNDVLVVYFSGHSGSGPDDLYLGLSDSTSDRSTTVWIHAELQRHAGGLAGRRVVLILDGCQASANHVLRHGIANVSVMALCASREGGLVIEDPDIGFRGRFSLALERVLKDIKGDIDLDGYLSLDEVFLRVYPECVRNPKHGNQYPSLAGDLSHTTFLLKAAGLRRRLRVLGEMPEGLSPGAAVELNNELFKILAVSPAEGMIDAATTQGTLQQGFVELAASGREEGYWLAGDTLRRVEKLPATERSHAVLVGVGDGYAGVEGFDRVPRAADVVRDLAEALKRTGFGTVQTLCDGEATAPRVKSALARYWGDEAPTLDRFVFVFHGHGTKQGAGREPIMVTPDFDAQRPFETSLSLEELRTSMSRIPSVDSLLVIDACDSGVGDLVPRSDTVPFLTARGDAATDAIFREPGQKSRCLLTSTMRNELAGTLDGAGLLLRSLVAGLRGLADENGDAVLTTTELYGYCARQVQAEVEWRRKEDPGALAQHVGIQWIRDDDSDRMMPSGAQMYFVLTDDSKSAPLNPHREGR